MIVPLHDGGDTVEPVNSEQRVPFSVSAGVAVLCATLLLLFPASLAAQAGGVEVFGGTGIIRVGTDDGVIGDAVSVGGGVTVPLTGRWVAEVEAMTGRVQRSAGRPNDTFTTRRTMVVGSVLYRRCGSRACFFVGYGLGGQFVDSLSRLTESSSELRPRPIEVSPGMFELRFSEMRPVLFSPRGGFSFYPTSKAGARIDGGMTSWNSWIRLAVTYRLN